MGFTFSATGLTVSGIAVPLSATSVRVNKVLLQAYPTNAEPVFVGDSTVLYSGVTGPGIYINAPAAGVIDAPIILECSGDGNSLDLSQIYVNSVTGLPKVSFSYEKF